MKRTFLVILTMLLIVAGNTAPVIAKDNGKDNGKNDTKTAAEACKKEGWKDFADEDGNPFKNQGECVSFANQGGELVELDDDDRQSNDDDEGDDRDDGDNDADQSGEDGDDGKENDDDGNGDDDGSSDDSQAEELNLDIVDGDAPWDGYLVGSGFTPGAEITSVTFASDRETLVLDSPVGTVINDDGTFETEQIVYWCSEYHGHGETSGTVTVEDSAGVTHNETFEMDTHCGPKE